MKAVLASGPGGPQVLSLGEADDPSPAAGEVLLDVAATAVNRADLLQRAGKYPPPAGASQILGLECSGRIAALGEGVTGWQVGDEVCALLSGAGRPGFDQRRRAARGGLHRLVDGVRPGSGGRAGAR